MILYVIAATESGNALSSFIYLMCGFCPLSMKYLTALNEPFEEAEMIYLTMSFHHSAFNFLCQTGAVPASPLSIQDSSVSSMLVTQAKEDQWLVLFQKTW